MNMEKKILEQVAGGNIPEAPIKPPNHGGKIVHKPHPVPHGLAKCLKCGIVYPKDEEHICPEMPSILP